MTGRTQDAAFRRIVGSALVGSACRVAAGCGDVCAGTLRFEVRAGSVERGGELTAGKSADERVSVTLPGETYDPPVEVEREEIRRLVENQTMQGHGRAVLADFDEKRIHGRARLREAGAGRQSR